MVGGLELSERFCYDFLWFLPKFDMIQNWAVSFFEFYAFFLLTRWGVARYKSAQRLKYGCQRLGKGF